MKKTLLLAGLSLFLLTGCGNKVTCSGEVEEDGQKYKMEVKAEFDGDDKLKSASAVMKFEDETTATSFCGILELANSFAENEEDKISYECKDNKITINSFEKMAELDDEEKITKAEFIEEMESEDLTCKK